MGEMNEDAKLAKLCVNCNHLGTAHAKLNIKRNIMQSWSFEPCRKCKEDGKKKICENFKPRID